MGMIKGSAAFGQWIYEYPVAMKIQGKSLKKQYFWLP